MSSKLSTRLSDVYVNVESPLQVAEYDAIVARLAADAPGRVLDWGAGLGLITRLLRERGIETEAFEYRPEEPEPRRGGLGAPSIEGWTEVEGWLSPEPVALPFEDDAFDTVLSLGVLEHVQDPDESLEEIRRVLKPGGRLYVYKLPNRWSYLERIAKALGMYYHGQLPFDRVYDKRSAMRLLTAHGFAVEEFRRTNLLPLRIPVKMRRLTRPIWALNRALRFVPGFSFLATNVELVARDSAKRAD